MRVKRLVGIGTAMAAVAAAVLFQFNLAEAASTCSGTRFATVVVKSKPGGVRMGRMDAYSSTVGSNSIGYCFKVTREGSYVSGYVSEIQLEVDGRTWSMPVEGALGNPVSISRTVSHCSTCGNHSYFYRGWIQYRGGSPYGYSDGVTVR
jgi:hypothetical protein